MDVLRELVTAWFERRVKYAIDVEKGAITIGGDLDAQAAFRDAHSNLWESLRLNAAVACGAEAPAYLYNWGDDPQNR